MTNPILLALCNLGLMMLCYKWKLLEHYDLYRSNRFFTLPSWCDLCFFFWTAAIEYTIIHVDNLICIRTFLSIFAHAMATCVISLILDKLRFKVGL